MPPPEISVIGRRAEPADVRMVFSEMLSLSARRFTTAKAEAPSNFNAAGSQRGPVSVAISEGLARSPVKTSRRHPFREGGPRAGPSALQSGLMHGRIFTKLERISSKKAKSKGVDGPGGDRENTFTAVPPLSDS